MSILVRSVKTSKNKFESIVSYNPIAIEFFNNCSNYADIVLNQINEEKMYDKIFENKTDMVILDIGGNIGLFSIYAQDSAKIIYTFEPTPSHFNLLHEFTANYDNIVPINMAITNYEGEIAFYTNNENTTMNSIVQRSNNKIMVPCIDIFSFIKSKNLNHVDLIKCDIEGSEMTALTYGIIESLKDIVDNWFVKVHDTNNKTMAENKSILKYLFERNGYNVTEYRGDGLIINK
jgi:FkbM family methyltransferase